MPARVSESFVLRTFPLRESDLIVSFFTRDQGKLRGVAKRARRPKSPFGAGLERLAEVRIAYFQRENRELANVDSCEIIRSQFDLMSSYETGVGLDYLAEVAEQILPPGEPNERFFRLLRAVLEHLHQGGAVWTSVAYFSLWAVRLAGILPELRVGQESESIAMEMLTTPSGELTPRTWTKATAADLRRFLVRQMEEHIERRLLAAAALEAL